MSVSAVLGILFAVLFVLVVVGLYTYSKLLKRLKKKHLNTWESLGSPTL